MREIANLIVRFFAVLSLFFIFLVSSPFFLSPLAVPPRPSLNVPLSLHFRSGVPGLGDQVQTGQRQGEGGKEKATRGTGAEIHQPYSSRRGALCVYSTLGSPLEALACFGSVCSFRARSVPRGRMWLVWIWIWRVGLTGGGFGGGGGRVGGVSDGEEGGERERGDRKKRGRERGREEEREREKEKKERGKRREEREKQSEREERYVNATRQSLTAACRQPAGCCTPLHNIAFSSQLSSASL